MRRRVFVVSSPFHSRFARRAFLGVVVLIAGFFLIPSSKDSAESRAPQSDTTQTSHETASTPAEEQATARNLASEASPAAEGTREKTYRKFSDLYGQKSPLIQPLFEWAILGFRGDRGSLDYAEERKKLLTQLNQDPSATLALLTSGQEKFPRDWGIVRNAIVNLVGHLDVPNSAKAEFLSSEILRAPRLADENGEADADSFALATAIDYLSRVGSDADAKKILETLRSSREQLSKAQLEFVLTRMAAYFPEVTAPFTQELLGSSDSH